MDLDSGPRLPELAEVLNGTAPPPYSLDSFRLFLYHSQCSEILNFLECAKAYRGSFASAYVQLGYLSSNSLERPEVDLLLQLWRSLTSTFLLPGSLQEVSLSNEERMSLLSYRNTAIPLPPYILEPVVRRLYDQVEESIFPTFLLRHGLSGDPSQILKYQGYVPWEERQVQDNLIHLLPDDMGRKVT